uniref:Uncharacterized protein n=1 Tax=Arundo donax TaxID=35708 RepID=A0A0A8ZS60_ARUDO
MPGFLASALNSCSWDFKTQRLMSLFSLSLRQVFRYISSSMLMILSLSTLPHWLQKGFLHNFRLILQ